MLDKCRGSPSCCTLNYPSSPSFSTDGSEVSSRILTYPRSVKRVSLLSAASVRENGHGQTLYLLELSLAAEELATSVYHPRKKNLIRRSVSDENIKHFCVSLRINARYSYVYQSVNVIDESLRNDFMEKSHIYKYDISHSERQLVKQRLIVLYENWNRSAYPRTTSEIVKICAEFYPPKCVPGCPVWSLPSHCAPRHLHTG